MRLTLDALETLDAIAEHGSFAKAAAALHRVPSAVTYTVRKLESDLGVALFDRSGRRPAFTPAGRALLERGRELLRQAEALENQVKRAADGWETQLTLAVDELLPLDLLFPLIAEFDALHCGTHIRLTSEILAGAWDAVVHRRADLAVAAPGDTPQGYGLSTRKLGRMTFVFACAPGHAAAKLAEPITAERLREHRSVVVADSSRRLAPRSSGVLQGQDALIVPSLAAKLAAQVAGLGVGHLPGHLARAEVDAGRLVVRQVENPPEPVALSLAWHSGGQGRALRWFRERLLADAHIKHLLQS